MSPRLAAALALLVGLAAAAAAQEVKVTADVDARRVGVEDVVEYTVRVEAASLSALPAGAEVLLPPLTNLKVVGGPSSSTQVSFVNGAVSQSRSYTWVLQPGAPGRAEIGPARVRVPSGEQVTPPIAVEVVGGSIRPRQRSSSPFADPFGGGDPFESIFGPRGRTAGPPPKLAVQALPTRTRLHVGEPLLLTYYVYTQASLSDLQFTDAPSYPGFWSEEVEKPRTPPGGEPATIEGEPYRRFPVLQRLLFPTKSGSLTIPPATLRISVPRQSVFDRGAVVERATEPVKIDVIPLPEEPGFSGAVGQFKVTAALDRASATLGDAATLRFSVAGTGNLKWVDRGPTVEVPGAKVYPPQVKSDLAVQPTGITGTRTWEFVVVPETAGTLRIPALRFAWFDPARGLVREETTPLELAVAPGTGVPAPLVPAPARGASALRLRSDLETGGRRWPVLHGRGVALGLLAFGLLHLGVWAAGRVSFRRRGGTSRAVDTGTVRHALGDLDRAVKEGRSKEAAAALIEKALTDVFGEVDAGAPADAREREARALLEEVQFIRYAPQLGDYTDKIRDVAARAAALVKTCV